MLRISERSDHPALTQRDKLKVTSFIQYLGLVMVTSSAFAFATSRVQPQAERAGFYSHAAARLALLGIGLLLSGFALRAAARILGL